MNRLSPGRRMWLLIVVIWLIAVWLLLTYPAPAGGARDAVPTYLPPPVMWTATPPAHAVYAPSIERGN